MTTCEELVTRRVLLADGRYLIYYTFGPDHASVSPQAADKELETATRDEET